MNRDPVGRLAGRSGHAGGLPLFRCVKINQVDVGGEVQFAAAEFAHAENSELGFCLAAIVVGDHRCAVLLLQGQVRDLVGPLQGRCGERREFVGNLGQVSHAVQVAGGDPQDFPALVLPQQGLQFLEVDLVGDKIAQLPDHLFCRGR